MIETNLKKFKSKFLISSIPIQQNLELFKHSNFEINYQNIPLIDYKSFFTITFMSKVKNTSIVNNPDENFSWICNNTLKGLRNKNDVFTLNTSPTLTKELLGIKKNKIEVIVEKKLKIAGIDNFKNLSIHFWKYAYSNIGSETDSYWNNQFNLGL